MNDVLVNKIQSIQRCVERAREEYAKNTDGFADDFTRQDAAILNILRACEQTIDCANYLVRSYRLGIPRSSAESFDLLLRKSIIGSGLADALRRMVSFRNIAVHQYDRLEITVVEKIITQHLGDFTAFTDAVMAHVKAHPI